MTTKTLPGHPAKFPDAVLRVFSNEIALAPNSTTPLRVLDPFAGVGRIHKIRSDKVETTGVEIEPEWAEHSPYTICADALDLPFPDDTFDAIATSPVYGNRMSDHHNATDTSRRVTYRHTLGRPLHPNNSGQLQWGDKYRQFHEKAWAEALRVLKPKGVFMLNVSDHIRAGERMRVTDWHRETLIGYGLSVITEHRIPTARMRFGSNSNVRVEYESVIVFRKGVDN